MTSQAHLDDLDVSEAKPLDAGHLGKVARPREGLGQTLLHLLVIRIRRALPTKQER